MAHAILCFFALCFCSLVLFAFAVTVVKILPTMLQIKRLWLERASCQPTCELFFGWEGSWKWEMEKVWRGKLDWNFHGVGGKLKQLWQL